MSLDGRRAAALRAAALSLCLVAGAALADAEAGRQKAQICAACHGPEGRSSNPAVPSIAGQPGQAISMQLFQFSQGNRKDPQMSPIAENLSNADMNDLAAYFSALPTPAPSHETRAENVAAGKALTEKFHCVQCHGPTLMGQQHIPRLAGQHLQYLEKQLRGFKAGTRADFDGSMTSASQLLSDKDIEVLGDYLSGLAPR